jgi:hypothetical protein
MNKQKGFSTLLIVIIIGSIVTGLILYIGTAGLWSVRGSIGDKNSMQADQIANACAELALESMRENNLFTGSSNSSIGASACNYDIINNGGDNRIIQVTGTVGNITRKIKITTDSFNAINIVSWENVGDF